MSDFNSFCTRMWLDNEDENLTLPAAGNRMTRDEYVERWYDWLVDKWQNRDLLDDTRAATPLPEVLESATPNPIIKDLQLDD